MVKEFRIIFDNPSAQSNGGPSVLSGSEVSGMVIVKVEEPKKYKCVKIFLKGKGHISRTTSEYHTICQQNEKYVNFVTVLWDKSQSPGPDHVLPAGRHRFPFQFNLPSSLPSSFEGGIAWIRYYLKAKIFAGSFKLVNKHTIKTPLLVTEVVDINTPEFDRPLRLWKTGTFGYLSSVSGPVIMTIEVPRTGYCVGEEIPFRVTVENGSNHRIECVVQLQQHTLFPEQSLTIRNHQRHSPLVFHATRRSSAIEAHTTSTWVPNDRVLTVPSYTPVTINTKIIKRYFQLAVILISNTRNLVILIPITIGNVLRRQGTQPVIRTAHAHSLASPEASVISDQTCVEPPSYASTLATPVSGAPVQATNVEPPSYEDAVSTMY